MAMDPSHISYDFLLAQIEELPQELQVQLHKALSAKLDESPQHQQKEAGLKAGWAKHLIGHIADDFDTPLDDFKEYME